VTAAIVVAGVAAWLAALLFAWALCRIAALGDRQMVRERHEATAPKEKR
jgi:hypothetical protein